VLDLRIFVDDKLPDGGTLVPKRGSWHLIWSMFRDLFYCVFVSAFCWF